MKKIWFYALSVLLIMASTSCKKEQEAEEVLTTVTDCEGNTYPVVKIGSQYWMAENLRCTKYDTNGLRSGETLSTSTELTFEPYYTDGRDEESEYSGGLTPEQRKRLGLLYNWAAAMGIPSGHTAEMQTLGFSGSVQGICPNGWHIPTRTEWVTLAEYVGGIYAGTYCEGKAEDLKSTSGWYEEIADFVRGADKYGFCVLPAGSANGSNVFNVGYLGCFWTATPDGKAQAYDSYFVPVGYCTYYMLYDKKNALSVRCVKNIQ